METQYNTDHPDGVLRDYLREYRRLRAECRYLLCREVYAMYRDFPGRNHGIVPVLRWYAPGKGWSKLEPGPVHIEPELVWSTRSAPIDVFRNQLARFSWRWFGYRSAKGSRATVSFGSVYRGPPDVRISRQSVSMRDAAKDYEDQDWGNPEIKARYSKLVEGHQERWKMINGIYQAWQSLRVSCEGVISHVMATHASTASCASVPAMRNAISKAPFTMTPVTIGDLASISVKKIRFGDDHPAESKDEDEKQPPPTFDDDPANDPYCG